MKSKLITGIITAILILPSVAIALTGERSANYILTYGEIILSQVVGHPEGDREAFYYVRLHEKYAKQNLPYGIYYCWTYIYSSPPEMGLDCSMSADVRSRKK